MAVVRGLQIRPVHSATSPARASDAAVGWTQTLLGLLTLMLLGMSLETRRKQAI